MASAHSNLRRWDAAILPASAAILVTGGSRLIGREREVATVRDLLRRDAVRLVTLTGRQGIGKTRLALEVASELNNDLAGQGVFVSLTSTNDPTLVASIIAEAIEAREIGGPSVLETAKPPRNYTIALLVLDNFEHVMSAAPYISDLLTRLPTLKILVTSRAPLRLAGEHEFSVPALTLPDLNPLPRIEVLSRCAAIQLFIERACAVSPDFSLSNINASVVAAICARLSGLPMAIELVAARMNELAPRVLLTQLNQRLSVNSPERLLASTREHPLSAILEWSYRLLSPGDQLLLARLSVLVGTFTSEIAETICAETSDCYDGLRIDVRKGLKLLVSKALVVQIPSGLFEGAEEQRFLILEPVREYALDRLRAAGEVEKLRKQHATYYLMLAERPSFAALPVLRLALENDNLRAAIQWALDRDEIEMALRFCVALSDFWIRYGLLSEGRRWTETTLARSTSAPAYLRAKTFDGVGRLAWYQSDQLAAKSFLEESLLSYRALGDIHAVATILQNLGAQALYQGHYDRAKTCYEESLAIFRSSRVPWGIALAVEGMGHVAHAYGDDVHAKECYDESLGIWRELEYQRGIATALTNLAGVALAEGDHELASSLLGMSLSAFRNLGNNRGIAEALYALACLALDQGDEARAETLFRQGLDLFYCHREPRGIARCLLGLAEVAASKGRFERAVRLFGLAEATREAGGVAMTPIEHGNYLRCVAVVRGQIDETLFTATWVEGRTMTVDQALAVGQVQPEPEVRPENEQATSLPPMSAGTGGTLPAGLTLREVEVLRLVAQGLTNAQVAERLVLSPLTVNVHLRSIYSKLGVATRTAAARFAAEYNIV